MGLPEVRLWLVMTARRYGSHDPEDIAHIVIERALRHGTPLTYPYPYWRKAAYRQVVTEARHRQIEGRYLAEYQASVKDSLTVGVREDAKAKLRRACSAIGISKLLWLARYSRRRNHTGSERVKAYRLRQRLRTEWRGHEHTRSPHRRAHSGSGTGHRHGGDPGGSDRGAEGACGPEP